MTNESDGISGTDNIAVLFPDKPSAAPIPPQTEILETLDEFGLEIAGGTIAGVIIIGFRSNSTLKVSIGGKVPFSDAVSALEQVKFGILARDYSANLITNQIK